MTDLRLILSQGRKRIGLLVGAGAPTAVRVDKCNQIVTEGGDPLVLDVAGLTKVVVNAMANDDRRIIEVLEQDLRTTNTTINIEMILTRIRMLAQAVGRAHLHDLSGDDYEKLGERVCKQIGNKVCASLPHSPNPYSELVAWIAGTHRENAVEIFTPNYDLLLEEAFERARAPYFDGFTGAYQPFFDAASVASMELPSRWSRVWKLHGSLGWKISGEAVVRTGMRNATELIYPDHLKYDLVTKLPYAALFERLRHFLMTPDTLLICSGFSFRDSHICSALDESLAANRHTAVLAFQHGTLSDEESAARLAARRPNMSLYARDGAIISGVSGQWELGELPTDDWENIRKTFWNDGSQAGAQEFLLGDFTNLARFLALTHSQKPASEESELGNSELTAARAPEVV